MALGSVLKDEARTIREVEGQVVNGAKTRSTVTSDWFRCRYNAGDDPETRDEGRVQRNKQTRLLTKDKADVRPGDKLDVRSDELTGGQPVRFEVSGTPKPIRKKRRVIGFIVPISKVSR